MKTFDIYINPKTGKFYACDRNWISFKKDPTLSKFYKNNHFRTHTIISSTRSMRKTLNKYNAGLPESVISWHKDLYRK